MSDPPTLSAMLPGPNTGAIPLILASASGSRRRMLAAAGIDAIIMPASVDEKEMKLSLTGEGAPPERIADSLAEMKAMRISAKRPDAMVIGADQTLALDGMVFDKPEDIAGARNHLLSLQGRAHKLYTSAVVARDRERIWGFTDTASLQMRPLPEETVDRYLDAVGDRAFDSVGAYQLEGLGAQLFSKVEGDFFTILGLPLLPLIGFLRQNGLVAA